jgi:hypothetical protein
MAVLCRIMDIIPLIRFKKRKIPGYPKNFLKEILKDIKENEKIYILDLDGIEKDKPNLCTFQRISSSYELWVDFGPRNLGDIVDAVMAGATNITLRKPPWPDIGLSDIKDITENKIFTNIDFKYQNRYDLKNIHTQLDDGLVNFNTRETIESNLQNSDLFKRISKEKPIFTYVSDLKDISYWKRFGIKGVLVDINKIKELKNEL